MKARQENLRKGRCSLGCQLERLTEAYLGEVIASRLSTRGAARTSSKERRLWRPEERQLQAQAASAWNLSGWADSIEDFCARVGGGLAEGDLRAKKKLVVTHPIDRVIVTGEEVEIVMIPHRSEADVVGTLLSFAFRLSLTT